MPPNRTEDELAALPPFPYIPGPSGYSLADYWTKFHEWQWAKFRKPYLSEFLKTASVEGTATLDTGTGRVIGNLELMDDPVRSALLEACE